jgi:hypothetical protein
MKIDPRETFIVGNFVEHDGKTLWDQTAQRIFELTKSYLRKIAVSASGWETLYLDEMDGRYWEYFHPQAEMHGGGPPALRLLSDEQTQAIYGGDINSA